MKSSFPLLTSLLLAPLAAVHAATLEIVRDGKVINLVHPEPGHVYASKGGAVEVRDPRKVFAVDAKLGAEFVVKARLRIERAERSAATMVFDEKDMFGFGGSAGKMFLHSARLKGAKLDRPAPQVVLDGKMFDLEIARSAAAFAIRIDGENIVEMKGQVPEIRSLGLRPWGGVMWIESFVIKGDVEKDNKAGTLRTDGVSVDPERNPKNATAGERALWAEHLSKLPRIDLSENIQRTVWASFDGGRTWPVKRLVHDGPGAYSTLAVGRAGTPSQGKIYLLFEGGPKSWDEAVQVAAFNLSWVLNGRDIGTLVGKTNESPGTAP